MAPRAPPRVRVRVRVRVRARARARVRVTTWATSSISYAPSSLLTAGRRLDGEAGREEAVGRGQREAGERLRMPG